MNALETRPRTVALVALGPSKHEYLNAVAAKKNALRVDEIWAINALAGAIPHHKIFLMDDLHEMQSKYPDWAGRLKSEKTPIITCRQYDDFPSSVSYPIDEVMAELNDDWFSNTVAYAIAYAIFIKVTDLYIFGADFFYPGSASLEPGADCCAYWLGRARERGVRYRIPSSSTLMDSHIAVLDQNTGRLVRQKYGYDYNPGRMLEKVERGHATLLEQKLAAKAPSTILGGSK